MGCFLTATQGQSVRMFDEIDHLVEDVVLRCPGHADVRHKMRLNFLNSFGVDLYVESTSIYLISSLETMIL